MAAPGTSFTTARHRGSERKYRKEASARLQADLDGPESVPSEPPAPENAGTVHWGL